MGLGKGIKLQFVGGKEQLITQEACFYFSKTAENGLSCNKFVITSWNTVPSPPTTAAAFEVGMLQFG